MTSAECGVLAVSTGLLVLAIIGATYGRGKVSVVLPPDRSCVVCWDGHETQTVELPGTFPLDVEFQLAPTGGYVKVSYTDKEDK